MTAATTSGQRRNGGRSVATTRGLGRRGGGSWSRSGGVEGSAPLPPPWRRFSSSRNSSKMSGTPLSLGAVRSGPAQRLEAPPEGGQRLRGELVLAHDRGPGGLPAERQPDERRA